MIRATVAGQHDLQAADERIKKGHRQLRPELAAGLRKPTAEGLRRLRAAIAGADMSGKPRPGRRTRFPRGAVASSGPWKRPLANAFEAKVSTSSGNPRAEIVLRETKVPFRKRPLVRYVTGQTKSGLRHPIPGHRNIWVGQNMPDVWHPTVANRATMDAYRAAAKDAVGRVAQKMARG